MRVTLWESRILRVISILIDCRYSQMSSHYATIQKAKKILSSYDEIEPRKYCIQPHVASNCKDKQLPNTKHKQLSSSKDKRLSSASPSRSTSNLKKDFSFCRSRLHQASSSSSLHRSPASILKRSPAKNTSFTSLYGRETRYDKIMKLKVKPVMRQTGKEDRTKKSVLDSSRSSIGSQKENRQRNQSRLDKIMQLKVNKPKVASTLIHYQPKQGIRTVPPERKESAAKEWRESQQKLRRGRQQQEREDRLWKVFERQRQMRCKLRKEAEEREEKQRRRREQRFQSMVGKEVAKIQRDREVSKRKSEGFSNYIYPFF